VAVVRIDYKVNTAQVTKANKAVRDLNATNKKAVTGLASISTQSDKTGAALRNLKTQSQTGTTAFGGLATSARQLAGALGFTGVVFALVGAFRNAIKTVIEFQKANAVLAGVLNTTRKGVAALTEDAKRLGAQTAKTATEVTNLQIAFARLGFTQREILAATEATINGSIALNAELASTAQLVGAVVRTFDDLAASDTEEILDRITRSTQVSSNSFETLSTSLPKVAGAANAMGISLRDVLRDLSIVQDATQDASIAGTSLRKIYLTLAETGLTLDESLQRINSSQNKVNEAVKLFDVRAAIAALALANNTDRARELEGQLDETGASAAAAATQLDTMKGSTDLLTSAYSGLITSIDDGNGPLSTFWQGFQDGVTNGLTAIRIINEETSSFIELLLALSNPAIAYGLIAERSKKNAEAIQAEKEAIKSFELAQRNGIKTADGFLLSHKKISEQFGIQFELTPLVIAVMNKFNEAEEDTKLAAAAAAKAILEQTLSTIELTNAEKEAQEKKDKSAKDAGDKLAKERVEREANATAEIEAISLERAGFLEDAELRRLERQLENTELTEGERQLMILESELIIQEIRAKSNQVQLDDDREALNKKLQASSLFFSQAAELAGRNSVFGKAAAIAQASIDTYVAANKALSAFPPPFSFVVAATTIATGLANVAKISSTKNVPRFAEGVIDLQGRGTATSDSITARLSRGESVMTARETSNFMPTLKAIRRGQVDPDLINGVADGSSRVVDNTKIIEIPRDRMTWDEEGFTSYHMKKQDRIIRKSKMFSN
jgi:hypothetical protein